MESEGPLTVSFQVTQNLFDHFPEMILHPVNCVSLGRDPFSKQIKRVFPSYFMHYSRQVLRKHLLLSRPEAVELDTLFGTHTCVILPIQGHWRDPVLPISVKNALQQWKDLLIQHKSASVGMPEFEGPPAGWLETNLRTLLEDIPWNIQVYMLQKGDDSADL
jgi:hypothetical protein